MKTIFAFSCFSVLCLQAAASQVPSNGSLLGTGYNGYGALGIGNSNNVDLPVQIVTNDVAAIAGGGYHSVFLKSDGSLWTMGDGQTGQLGNGNTIVTYAPGQVVASNVTAISAGEFHTLFLKSDGSLWGMGENSYGQLGIGTTNNANSPVKIVASNVTAIAAGGNHSLFIWTNGSLWSMGNNDDGQLGNGTRNFGATSPQMIVSSNVIAVAGGDSHSLFIKSDGSLWGMGQDGLGELGDGTYGGTGGSVNSPEQIVGSNVVAIAGGGTHSLFIKSDGSLWAMGYNWDGQLGDGTTDDGNYATNRPEQIVSSNVTAIAAGDEHSLFLKGDGSLWAMGTDGLGELGNGSFDTAAHGNDTPQLIVASNVTRIAAGYFHSLFLESVPLLPQPVITTISLSGANVILAATNGLSNGIYCTLKSPIVSQPVSNWTSVQTNALSAGGNFTVTVTNGFNLGAPQEFFMLKLQ